MEQTSNHTLIIGEYENWGSTGTPDLYPIAIFNSSSRSNASQICEIDYYALQYSVKNGSRLRRSSLSPSSLKIYDTSVNETWDVEKPWSGGGEPYVPEESYLAAEISRSRVFTRGDLVCYGDKNRVSSTEDYGERKFYCYEITSPMFGDVGEGVIGDDGMCYIQIDPVFSETINTYQYQVFLQKYGEGECYVSERNGTYFMVSGTPGLAFGWEIKGKQAGNETKRLERIYPNMTDGIEYGDRAVEHMKDVEKERRL